MHEAYMRRCIELAKQAQARGNIPVGSLVVLNDKIIAEASEELPTTYNITGHAEIIAIQKACDALQTTDLQQASLYTTAEPCWMCSYAVRETRISQVVIGSKTLDVGGISTNYPLLVAADIPVWGIPPKIIMGILEDDCDRLRS